MGMGGGMGGMGGMGGGDSDDDEEEEEGHGDHGHEHGEDCNHEHDKQPNADLKDLDAEVEETHEAATTASQEHA